MKNWKKLLIFALIASVTFSVTASFSGCKKGDNSSTEQSTGEGPYIPVAPDETPDEAEQPATSGLSYSLTESGTYSVSVGTATNVKKIVIPSEYEGKPVTLIGSGAFENCTSLEEVVIGRKVECVLDNAFKGCTALTSVELPYGAVDMYANAFSGCSALRYMEYEGGAYLGNKKNAFKVLVKAKDDAVKKCIVHDHCRTIAKLAFFGHENLEEVVVAGNVERINDMAFSDCAALKTVTVNYGVKIIGEDAFNNSGVEEIVLPDSVHTVEAAAFLDCAKLTTARLGKGVKTVGKSAFAFCPKLKTFSVPSDVESFATDALLESNAVNTTTYDGIRYIGNEENPYVLILAVDYYDKETFTTHENTRFILDGAFEDMIFLKEITLTDKVVGLGFGAFIGCNSIKTIHFGKNVKEIGAWAFADCTGLEEITFGEKVESIGTFSFMNTAIVDLKIPDALKSIGDGAFYNAKVETIDFGNGLERIGSGAFSFCPVSGEITIPASVNYIGSSIFGYNDEISGVVFQDPNGWLINGTEAIAPGSLVDKKNNVEYFLSEAILSKTPIR